MGTHPIFESDFDCLTERKEMATQRKKSSVPVTAMMRLKNDFMRIKREPIPLVYAEPDPTNMLVWHYCVRGPIDTPYEGGYFHGKLIFPKEFPFKPPSIFMMTPNGRFKTHQRLCLSISDFHPDTWNPAWSVGTILTGLLSFMVEESSTYGSMEASTVVRRRLARQSATENLKNEQFVELFPKLVKEIKESASKARTEREQKEPNQEPKREATAKEPEKIDAAQTDNTLINHLGFCAVIIAFALLAGMILNGESGP